MTKKEMECRKAYKEYVRECNLEEEEFCTFEEFMHIWLEQEELRNGK